MSYWSTSHSTSSSSSDYYTPEQIRSYVYYFGNTFDNEKQDEEAENEVMPKELIMFDPKDLRL